LIRLILSYTLMNSAQSLNIICFITTESGRQLHMYCID